jgi:hypothetical protein
MSEFGLKKTLLFTAIVTLAALLCLLFAGEIYIRLFSRFGKMSWDTYRAKTLRYEAGLFSRYNFAREAHDVVSGTDKRYHINSKGYRGREFEWTKPKGVTRIIIYGGSTVFDSDANDPNDWPHLVEKILRQNGYPDVEVINGGVPGSASLDAFGRFYGEGHLLQPDYVLFYGIWNDLKYFHYNKPALRFDPALPENDPVSNPRNWLDKLLGNHSQLYFRARMRYGYWKYRVGPEGIKSANAQKTSELSPMQLAQYKVTMQLFVDLARDINAAPVLVTEATLITRDNPAAGEEMIRDYLALDREGVLKGYEACTGIIKAVGAEKKADVIDAHAALSGKKDLFVDHVHTTEKGSQALAQLVAEELIKIFKQKP